MSTWIIGIICFLAGNMCGIMLMGLMASVGKYNKENEEERE